jgi:hypothetical protein
MQIIFFVFFFISLMDLFETSALTYEETVERPVYGYLLHNDEQRLEILEKCPNISAKDLSITITNSWKSFSEVYLLIFILSVFHMLTLTLFRKRKMNMPKEQKN